MIILCDSIVKDLPSIDGVFIKSYPGATIAQFAMHIDNRHVNLVNFDYMIVHVGTNNIDRRDEKGAMLSDFGNLIGRIKIKKPFIRIIVSSILPRQCDHTDTDGMIKEINTRDVRKVLSLSTQKQNPSYQYFDFCSANDLFCNAYCLTISREYLNKKVQKTQFTTCMYLVTEHFGFPRRHATSQLFKIISIHMYTLSVSLDPLSIY